MAIKITGLSRDLVIHPGETIADVLEDRGITQAELATRTGVSPAYISSVISGKKGISTKFAMSLEYALGIPKSFWMNLQANYDSELLELNEEQTITDGERQAYRALSEVSKYLRQQKVIPVYHRIEEAILSLRKALQISNLENLVELVPQGTFRMATKTAIDSYVLGAWIRLCQIAGDTSKSSTCFDQEQTNNLITEIKTIMTSHEGDPQQALVNTMGRYGIDFSVVQNFRGAPVQGYISQKKDGVYQMTLTIRGSYADIFWFSLFHEIGHIVNGDASKGTKFIDGESNQDTNTNQEQAADLFASNALLSPESYSVFVERNDFSFSAISRYADTQGVKPYIVIGRLQKEKRIPYSWYSNHKLRYKWAKQ